MPYVRCLPLLAALSTSTAWAAAPGGSFEFKATSARANGTIRIAVSGDAVRSDMDLEAKGMGAMKVSLLVKNKKSFLLNATDKTYSEVGPDAVGMAGQNRQQKFTAKKLGTAKVGQWTTIHAEITEQSGEKAEIWTTKEIALERSIFDVLGQRTPGDDGMMKALEAAGAGGFPVKMVSNKREGLTLELVKAELSKPSAALFDIPSDWKKANAASVAAGSLPPEARKKLEEAMRNMTPEQRKQMEEAMKAHAAGK